MIIRKADLKDIDFIAMVCRDAQVRYNEIMPDAFDKQAKKYKERGLPETYSIGIIEEVAQLGFCAYKDLKSGIRYIVGLYILSIYQDIGYGRKTLDLIIDIGTGEKVSEVLLLVHKEADWAISFYKNYGFKVIGRSEEEISDYLGGCKDVYIPNTLLMSYLVESNDFL